MANTLKFGNGNWATKEDSVLAYNDENNNFKPLPFDFTRASTATYVDSDGLIKTARNGEARIDYTDSTDGALLLEPARTNLITYSEDFSNAYWNKSSTSVVSGFVSPSGTLNAFKFVENTSNSNHWMYSGVFNITATNNNFSFFVKPNGRTKVAIRESGNTGKYASFNLTTKSVIDQNGTDAKIEEMSNGWLRISFNNLTTTVTAVGFFLLSDEYVSGQPYGQFYTGDGASGVYIWGAQAEAGSYATSYIPTSGSAVTRVGETPSQTPTTGIIGQTEGTIYFESEINGLQGSDMRFQLSDGSASNWIFISAGEATGTGVKGRGYINNGNVNQFSAYSVYLSAGKHKYALAYKQNDIAFYVDGTQVLLDTTATIPSLNKISLCGPTPLNETSSHFQKYDDIKLYNTRLSNSELETLTT